jgi:hypothetical protein
MEVDWTYSEEGIPLPQRNKLRVGTPKNNVEEED